MFKNICSKIKSLQKPTKPTTIDQTYSEQAVRADKIRNEEVEKKVESFNKSKKKG